MTWKVPAIGTAGALANWCGVTPDELDWFADLRGLIRRRPGGPLEHYHYRVRERRSGGMRLIEAPKERLKAIQRTILAEILTCVPPHPSAHGFVHGRSIRTFAAPHVGQRVVLRMDLTDFFPSIPGERLQAIFRTAGYPESVADLLGGICTNAAPRSLCGAHSAIQGDDPHRELLGRHVRPRSHSPRGPPRVSA